SNRARNEDPLGDFEVTFESRVMRALCSSAGSPSALGERVADDRPKPGICACWGEGASGICALDTSADDSAGEELRCAVAFETCARFIVTRQRKKVTSRIMKCPRAKY